MRKWRMIRKSGSAHTHRHVDEDRLHHLKLLLEMLPMAILLA